MIRIGARLFTPVYLQTDAGPQAWPADSVFYVLAGNGLFLCRNHEFFRSAVPVSRWPAELAPQDKLLEMRFPMIPQPVLEQVVGFFDRAYKLRAAESVVLPAFNRVSREVEIVVPRQTARSFRNARGDAYAESVHYTPPADLVPELLVFGDIHSHCDMAAYASSTDRADETYANGLHIVVGRLDDEPPQFHVEAVVDGTRFIVVPSQVLEGYQARDLGFPGGWLDQLEVEYYGHPQHGGHCAGPDDCGHITQSDPYGNDLYLPAPAKPPTFDARRTDDDQDQP